MDHSIDVRSVEWVDARMEDGSIDEWMNGRMDG